MAYRLDIFVHLQVWNCLKLSTCLFESLENSLLITQHVVSTDYVELHLVNERNIKNYLIDFLMNFFFTFGTYRIWLDMENSSSKSRVLIAPFLNEKFVAVNSSSVNVPVAVFPDSWDVCGLNRVIEMITFDVFSNHTFIRTD